MKICIDFETFSECDIKKRGSWVYSEHPSTDIWCCAVKVDDQPSRIWITPWAMALLPKDHGLPLLTDAELFSLLEEAGIIEAHNVSFEVGVMLNVATPKYNWPKIPAHKLRCSAAKAAYHALPRSLDGACKALGLPVQKDNAGYKTMLKLCRPRKPTKNNPSTRHQDPADVLALMRYCLADTEAEHALSQALADLPAKELAIWRLDQEINARGIQADVESAKRMVMEIDAYEKDLLEEVARLTNQRVNSPKQIAASKEWLASLGITTETLDKNAVTALLARKDLPQVAHRFLEIRRELGKSSTSKYQGILDRACKDGRIRGALLYHGCSTGRWASTGLNAQNVARGSITDPETAIDAIHVGGFDLVDAIWGRPMDVASSCIRATLLAKKGSRLICSDFASIEARVTAWLADEESVLQAYRKGLDLYIVAASGMFSIPYDKLFELVEAKDKRAKQLRQIGKTVVLACIAEGEEVLTDQGLFPIQEVTTDMRVWDGVEFVQHGGVVFNGWREVISYEGLVATADHEVFTESEGELRTVRFKDAASCGQHLVQSGAGRQAVRVGGDNYARETLYEGMVIDVCAGQMRQLRQGELGISLKPDEGDKQRLPSLLPAGVGPEVAFEEVRSDAPTLHESERRGVEALRGQGNRVQVPDSVELRFVDSGESWAEAPSGAGPREQRGALRKREYPLCDKIAEHAKYASGEDIDRRRYLGGAVQPLQLRQNDTLSPVRPHEGRDNRACETGGCGEAQTLAQDTKRPRVARVYDILNAGPRHRFTVSGKLVHNCGFAGGIGAYATMARNYGIDLETLPEHLLANVDDDVAAQAKRTAQMFLRKNAGAMSLEAAMACDVAKQLWRRANPNIVNLWAKLEEAAISAVSNPGAVYSFGKIQYGVSGDFLKCRLPSGRFLHYYRPEFVSKPTDWGQDKVFIAFWSTNSVTRQWEKSRTNGLYGGICVQNAVQATARDLMAEAMLRLERAGYPVVLSVHDEIVAEVPEGTGSLKEFEAIMAQVPRWAEGCPIGAEGWVGRRYKK